MPDHPTTFSVLILIIPSVVQRPPHPGDHSPQFRAFVGMTAFEDLCREWMLVKARAGKLPMVPEVVGSHWSTDAQLDVVAVNWHDNTILLGECKWGVKAVGRAVIRELIDKTPKVVPGEGWQVHYACFAAAKRAVARLSNDI